MVENTPIAVMLPPAVRIDVTVAKFHALKSCADPVKLCELPPTNPFTIIDPPDGRAYQVPGDPTIRIKRNLSERRTHSPIDLVFTIKPDATYSVAGAAFSRDGLQALGGVDAVFEIKSMVGNQLAIRDHFPHDQRGRWELFIIIQNTQGEIGIIDPGIENEN